jgi:hypothetical protein
MTTARVLIDLQEGIIEIEGPVEFVEKHMTRFLSDEEASVEDKPVRRRGRPAKTVKSSRKKRKASCGKVISNLLETSFFNKARGFGVIKQEVLKGVPDCSDNLIRNAIKETVASGKLSASGAGRGMKYNRVTAE